MDYKKLFKIIVFILGLVFLFYYIHYHLEEVESVLSQLSITLVVLAIIFTTGAHFTQALLNALLLKEFLHTKLPQRRLIFSFTQSQIVKYIPGRFWGVMFQASTISQNIQKRDVWIVNLYELLITNGFNLLIAVVACLIFVPFSLLGKLIIFSVGSILCFVLYRKCDVILKLLKTDSQIFKKYTVLFNGKLITKIFALLVMEWLLYISMWVSLCFQQFSVLEIVLIAINYAVALVVGILFFIVPNGLVVREATFISIGKYLGWDMEFLIVYGLFVRLLFMSGDFILYVITLIFDKIMPSHERSKNTLG